MQVACQGCGHGKGAFSDVRLLLSDALIIDACFRCCIMHCAETTVFRPFTFLTFGLFPLPLPILHPGVLYRKRVMLSLIWAVVRENVVCNRVVRLLKGKQTAPLPRACRSAAIDRARGTRRLSPGNRMCLSPRNH